MELLHHHSRRHPPVRRCFHRNVLHPAVPVDGQLLLRFRFPYAGVHHPGDHMRRHRHGVLLLPALCRGLQLVSQQLTVGERLNGRLDRYFQVEVYIFLVNYVWRPARMSLKRSAIRNVSASRLTASILPSEIPV